MGVFTSQGLPGSLSSTNDAAGGDEVGVSASQGLLGSLRSTNDAAHGGEVGVCFTGVTRFTEVYE